MVYAKGGGAWIGSNNSTVTDLTSGASISGPTSNWGWTVGAGAEYAFYGGWSARNECDYIGLTNQTFTVPTPTPFSVLPAGDQFTGSGRNIQMVTGGINYKFGGGWW